MNPLAKPLAARLFQRGTVFVAIVAVPVLGTTIVSRLTSPQPVIAQSSQAQSIRASEFILTGPDGTARARLGIAAGGPALIIYEPDGQTSRVSMGVEDANGDGGVRIRDANGIERGIFGINTAVNGIAVQLNYPDGQTPGITLGASLAGGPGRVAVRDVTGQVLAAFPDH